MKALPKKLLTLTLFGIGVTSLFSFQPAQAFTITIEQVGPNVVATGTGAINLAGLSFFNPGSVGTASVWPVTGRISMSSMSGGNADTYIGFTGPSSFGGGDVALANFSSGDVFAFDLDAMFLPSGYVSGNPLSDMAIYFTATVASLGLTPGTYVWTWGDWTREPERHASNRTGWCARWRLNSFSARLRFARLGCLAAQIGQEDLTPASPPKNHSLVIVRRCSDGVQPPPDEG